MSRAKKKRRVRDFLAPALAGVTAVGLTLQLSLANVLIDAANINPENKGKWAVISNVAKELQAPMLVTMLAAVPLGILGGGVLMAIGHRHAAKILGQVVAGLVVVGIGTNLAK
jgi:hypothetical protein